MKPVNKQWRFTEDNCGFAINGEIAREHRAIDFELERLKKHPNRDFPEIAQKIRELQARLNVIRHRLLCPPPHDAGHREAIRQLPKYPPSKGYGDEEISEDMMRLRLFARKREAGIALSTEEDAEEAHRKARFDCYMEGPERTARRLRQHLEAADNLFRRGRFFGVGGTAPLSRRERSDLWLLRWLYPPPLSKSRVSAEAEGEGLADGERWTGHPFHDEKPAVDGNFYPRDSKWRPESEYEIIVDEGDPDIPPYRVLVSGQPPTYTYLGPINSSSDKSDPARPNS